MFCINSVPPYLPNNDGRITFGATAIRRMLVKGFTGSKSSGLYINKNATLSPTLKIGNHSGIGADSIIGRGTTIGDNVMMGPACYIYTRNHDLRERISLCANRVCRSFNR